MADEYIKRSDALQFVFDACTECMEACEEFDGIFPDCNQCLIDGIKLKLRDMPTADVREVVYCKECRHYKPSELIPGDWLCCYHMGAKYYRDRNDFCSKGARGNG